MNIVNATQAQGNMNCNLPPLRGLVRVADGGGNGGRAREEPNRVRHVRVLLVDEAREVRARARTRLEPRRRHVGAAPVGAHERCERDALHVSKQHPA